MRVVAWRCRVARKPVITCWATVCASSGEGPVTSRFTSALIAGAVALIRPCSSSTLSWPPSTVGRIWLRNPAEVSSAA